MDGNLDLDGKDHVFNAVGTSGRKCQCADRDKSWLAHWVRGAEKELPDKCQAFGCRNFVEVGAHVINPENRSEIWIVPFCQHHNKRPHLEPILLKKGFILVGANWRVDCI